MERIYDEEIIEAAKLGDEAGSILHPETSPEGTYSDETVYIDASIDILNGYDAEHSGLVFKHAIAEHPNAGYGIRTWKWMLRDIDDEKLVSFGNGCLSRMTAAIACRAKGNLETQIEQFKKDIDTLLEYTNDHEETKENCKIFGTVWLEAIEKQDISLMFKLSDTLSYDKSEVDYAWGAYHATGTMLRVLQYLHDIYNVFIRLQDTLYDEDADTVASLTCAVLISTGVYSSIEEMRDSFRIELEIL